MIERETSGTRDARRPALPLLTSLRFFAAAAVVAFHMAHARAADAVPPDGFIKGLTSGGFAAVAFFFVLSGFILTYVHAGPTEAAGCDVRPATFWRLRFARIAPAYFLGLLLSLQFLVGFLLDPATPSWARLVGPLLVLFFLQAWWPSFSSLWNFPAWSVSVECLFYAVFPWWARVSARLPRWGLFLVSYGLVVAATVCRADFFALPDYLLPPDRPDLEFQAYFPLLHLPLFVFGMALGRQHLFGPTLPSRLLAVLFGLGVAGLLIVFGFGGLLPWWTRSDAVLVPLFALIILGATRPADGALLAHPWFVLLGEASYSIYILHIPVRVGWETMDLGLPAWLSLPLYVALVVAASILSLRMVETPLRRWIAGRGTEHRRALGALSRRLPA
jgi:peptidoglycan/LPS O-acetylase OafA/YrhL